MKTILLFTFILYTISATLGQEIKVGFKDSIHSTILNENRKFIVKLPDGYNDSNKSYPVIYRLDGYFNLYLETIGTINRLTYLDELVPEMIVVMIENTNRNRDMMPTTTSFFNDEPGAEKFKDFIQNELIPKINSSYRTTNEKILCGQSLSAIFTLYYFLTSPGTFDSYIASSGGFPDCEAYFSKLTTDFLKTQQTKPLKLFISHGQKDFLDPEGVIKKQLITFTEKIESKENIICKLKIYDEEGHVPFQSLYHALKFIYSADN